MSASTGIAAIERRKHPDRVTLAQISDLHFTVDTQVPRDGRSGDVVLERLRDDIAQQQPDVLVVTGDVADSGAGDAVYEDWAAKLRRAVGMPAPTFRDVLLHTWKSALQYFQDVCRACAIDPATRLFVVPGNHDYRVQGMALGIDHVEADFRGVFGPYLRDAHLAFGATDQAPIGLSIVSIDSNPTPAEYSSLATGLVRVGELRKLGFLAEARRAPATAAWFRICLLHHHPLPVVPAEVFSELRSDPGLLDRLTGAATDAFGAQTTLLRNAGAFLAAALSAEVDLVLHGHEHKAWVSELRYPAAEDFQRVLVAAAGSAHRLTADVYSYNVATLSGDGRVEIAQRCLERNLASFAERSRFPRYDEASLRIQRKRRRQRQLAGRPIPSTGLPVEPRYGSLRARRVARTMEIQADGNVVVTQSFDDLRAAAGEVRYFPLTYYAPGGYVGMGREPEVSERGSTTKVRVDVLKTAVQGRDQVVLRAEFMPPLTPERTASFDVRYRMCNAFDFVAEYRRGRIFDPDERRGFLGSREAITYRTRILFPERYVATVTFPENLAPAEAPSVRVLDESQASDALEHAYCNERLTYFKGDRTAVLSIDAVLPDLTYEISWPLLPKQSWDRHFDKDSLRRVRAVGGRAIDAAMRDRLTGLLRALRDEFGQKAQMPGLEEPLMDGETELGLFLTRQVEEGAGDQRAVRISLVRCAYLYGADTGETRQVEMPVGVGLAGQAYRTGTVLYDYSEGRSGVYQQDLGEREVHAFLCCVPLPALASGGEKPAPRSGREATYGILAIGSYRGGSGLEQLVSSEDPALQRLCASTLTDWIQGNFAKTVLETIRSA